jgi:anti-sigma regulatory factor (Ser/Thr protein kinase)
VRRRATNPVYCRRHGLESVKVRFRNDVAEHKRAQSALQDFCSAGGLNEACGRDLRLLVEEMFINVVSYAYPEVKLGVIDLSFERHGNSVVITIEDDGKPFDPLARPEADLSVKFHEREVGGHGVVLIRALSEHVDYDYAEQRNRLRASYRIR